LAGNYPFWQDGRFPAKPNCQSPPPRQTSDRDHGLPRLGPAERVSQGLEEQVHRQPPEQGVGGAGDFLATLYRHLGIDAERATVRDPSGRPVPLLQQAGAPIRELTAAR
jgi:hypothetical protein